MPRPSRPSPAPDQVEVIETGNMATRFGGSANQPRGGGGATKDIMKIRQQNGFKAMMIRERLLDAAIGRIETVLMNDPDQANERIYAMLNSDLNRLLTDSESRAFGQPSNKESGPSQTDDEVFDFESLPHEQRVELLSVLRQTKKNV
jgi:hypothetical protein